MRYRDIALILALNAALWAAVIIGVLGMRWS